MDALAQSTSSEAHPSSGDLPPRAIESGELLKGARELLIRHGDSTYRLRVTTSKKLILTK